MINYILPSLIAAIGVVLAQSSTSPASVSAPATGTPTGTPTTGSAMAQSSPAWLADVTPLPGNVQSYPTSAQVPTGPFTGTNITLQGYPPVWKSPPTDSPQVQAAFKSINWELVPNSTVRTANKDGTPNMSGYESSDPDCWWSATGCTTPKHEHVEPDTLNCPVVGDWGLTYDDGPLTSEAGEWAEPHLYDFLAQHNQKAALFYIGSNTITAPQAAQRALADGHTLCVHTWSHPAMTTQSNEQIVAELYWTLRAIKEVTGVTTRCWRPPYGDVDDRVRAIANQMGLTTVLWDEDTDDWNMPGSGGGNLSPETVDGYFEKWISARKNGTDNQSGHIILQHELNDATVTMAEKWLPQIQQVFRVVPYNQCMNVSNPYWETSFVYPTDANPHPSNITTTSSVIASATNSAAVAGATSTALTSGATSLPRLPYSIPAVPLLLMGAAYLL